MRPTKLKMSAFGPYKEETIIEFDKLGKSGIYLICGDTGSGKTTIFDAICFALYGEASGNNKPSRLLRCKYASENVATYVELEFEYRGKKYKINRNPEYERAKTRGSGFTVQKADATLFFDDERLPISKSVEVTKEVEKIIGLNRDEFVQISMIAQGDFQRLLFADTQERIKIFRQLFYTDKYKRLQEKLRTNAQEKINEYEKLKEIENFYKASINKYGEIVTNAESLDITRIEEIFLGIKENNKYFMAEKRKEQSEISKKDKELNIKIGEFKTFSKNKEDFENVSKEIEDLNVQLEKEIGDFKEVSKKHKESERLAIDIAREKEKLSIFENLKKIIDEKNKSYQKVEKISSILEKKSSENTALNEKLKADKEELLNLKDCKLKILDSKEKLEKINQRGKKLQNLKLFVKDYEKKELEYKEGVSAFKKENEIYDKLKRDYDEKNYLFLNAQAGILASRLEENMPCPVCGSKSHPMPAKLSTIAPSEKDVENAKKKSEEALQKTSDLSKKSAALNSELAAIFDRFSDLYEEVFKEKTSKEKEVTISEENKISENFDIAVKDLKCEKQNFEKLEKDEKRFDYLTAKTRELEEKINSLTKDIHDNEVEKVKLFENYKSLSKKEEESKKNLTYKNIEELENAIKKMQEQKDKVDFDFERGQKVIAEIKIKLNEKLGKQKTLEKLIKNKNTDDSNNFIEEQKILQKRLNELNEEISSQKTKEENLENFFENLLKTKKSMEEYEKELSYMQTLSQTANGMLSGKNKIMLETYVQQSFFDRILERASTRFMIMTSGQYELKRRDAGNNMKSQVGLDIDVIDHYNGVERSVRTLSGGESFMASLSLALGLSDEIQKNAGGIELDTMFVDEGFGTLDENYIEQAMKALANLSDGKRLVGIISHVDNLKNRIDKQIIVSKNKNKSSSVKLIV